MSDISHFLSKFLAQESMLNGITIFEVFSDMFDIKIGTRELLGKRGFLKASSCVVVALAALTPSLVSAQNSITVTRTNTVAIEDYTVPAGYPEADISIRGGDGGTEDTGGSGATTTATLIVATGDVLQSIVGQVGEASTNGGAGGGGGSAVCLNSAVFAAAGGGAGSDNTDASGGGAQNGGAGTVNGRDGLSRIAGARAGGTPSTTAEAGETSFTDVAAGGGGGGISGAGQSYTSALDTDGGGSTGGALRTAEGGGAAFADCSAISPGGIGVSESTLGEGTNGGSGFGGGGGSWGRAAGGGGGYSGGGGAGNSRWAGGGGGFLNTGSSVFISGNLTAGANLANLGRNGQVVITVFAQPTALNDTASGIDGVNGQTNVLNAFTDDMIGGVAASPSNVILAVATGSSVPTELTFNTSTGAIDVAPGTAGGSYSFTYEICNSDRTNLCTTAVVTVNVDFNADLSLTKTNTPGVNGNVDQASDTVTSGDTTTYTIVVTNNGPDSVSNAIVTDTIGTGLTCPSANTVTITGNGVPTGSFDVADLTGAGIILGTLANGEAATLVYSCQVN